SPSGEEAAVAAFIARMLADAGLEAEVYEADANRPNVVARLRGAEPGPTLLFQGHTDTIPVYGMPEPFSGRVENGAIHGRGACDMKGPLAAALCALLAAHEEGLVRRGELIVACTIDEEHEKRGIAALVQRGIRADFGVCCEPTGLRIAIGQKGALAVRVTTHGRATHGSTPERGVNAVVNMAKAILAVQTIELPTAEVVGVGRVAGTLNVGIVQGGYSHMVVPDTCRIWVDRRLAPGETPEQALAAISVALETLQRDDPSFEFEVDVDPPGYTWPPAVRHGTNGTLIEASASIVQLAGAAHTAVRGAGAPLAVMNAWTEADFLVNDAGIPTVIFGPGRLELAHSATERIEVEELVAGATIYREMIARALG
ncbi:MAG: M20 family metallopeptidase, partial [Chloroflexi bacterium]|nr:M20 family metallopeptidase [Chloroflexota bacterium]